MGRPNVPTARPASSRARRGLRPGVRAIRPARRRRTRSACRRSSRGDVDVALLFTTDPAITQKGLVELVDDRHLQPAENITPLVRTEVVEPVGDEAGHRARRRVAATHDRVPPADERRRSWWYLARDGGRRLAAPSIHDDDGDATACRQVGEPFPARRSGRRRCRRPSRRDASAGGRQAHRPRCRGTSGAAARNGSSPLDCFWCG